MIGFVCSTVSAAIGISLGLLAGYLGGKVDLAIMRLADVQLGFPFIVLAIAVIAILGSALPVLVGLLSIAAGCTTRASPAARRCASATPSTSRRRA